MVKRVNYRVRVPLIVGLLLATSLLTVFAQTRSAFAASSVTINGATTF
jgi:hypothetical protein